MRSNNFSYSTFVFNHMLYLRTLMIVAVVFFSAACSRPVTGATAATPVRIADVSDEDILFYVNRFRKEQGLAPLKLDDTVSAEAKSHSKNMAAGRTGFGHDGFEGRIADISKKIGRVSAAAENVAYGNLTAEAVVDGWIKSPGHRKNMLGKFNLIGIGTAKGKGNIIYFTQIFVNKPS